MKKSAVRKYPPDSAEYVVLHAAYQHSRGKGPSLPFLGVVNPRKALALAEDFAYFPQNGEYLRGVPLDDYKCADCGASGCKLWREYQTFSLRLLCAPCAAKCQGKDISNIDADGRFTIEHGRTDQIGWFIPAVPDENGVGYWGYTSVPRPGCDWWARLPTLPN